MSQLFSDCPTWLDQESWSAYCDWRASLPKKQRMTDFARKLILKELDRLRAQGHNPTECLNQSLMNSWLGVFPVKAHQQALDQAKPKETDFERTQRLLREQSAHKVGREGLEAFKARMGLQ